MVDPVTVSSLVAELRREPPRHLIGITWFRLPTPEDQRAWTLRTWQAVMAGKALRTLPLVVRFGADRTGAKDVYLQNGGDLDAKLPTEVSVSAGGCEFADALPPYELMQKTNEVRFRLTSDDMLPAGRERLVGWFAVWAER